MSTEKECAPEKRGDVDTVVSLLESHDKGLTMKGFSREVRDAIARAREMARFEGSATVKFAVSGTITITGKGRAEVKLSTACTPPRESHPTTTLYTAADGTLATADPRQPAFEFAKPARSRATEKTEKETE